MQDPLTLSTSSVLRADYRVHCPAKIATANEKVDARNSWPRAGYHLVDTAIIVIVIVIASRSPIAMRRSRRPLSR